MRIGLLASGNGSNFNAIYAYSQDPGGYEVALVVRDSIHAWPVRDKADKVGVASPKIVRGDCMKACYENKLHKAFIEAKVDFICCIGYMQIIGRYLLERWEGKILNVHPSLLPAYPGLHVHERVLKAKETRTGCTVHLVDKGIDTGKILAQDSCRVELNDTVETLRNRVLSLENLVYPRAIRKFANNLRSTP